MAKGFNKLAKFKSVLKKMQSFKLGRSSSTAEAVDITASDEEEYSGENNLQTVYVGKSRRRYLISADVTESSLFRELVRRRKPNHSNDGDENDDDGDSITVGCEVVLFEHLLWMLENAAPQQDSSLDELVDFYAC